MSSPCPFRFLDLPKELQMMILEYHYGSYGITASVSEPPRTLHLNGPPCSLRKIELVSRELHALATPLFRRAFNGIITFEIEDDEKPQALELYCAARRYAWIRDRVRTLEMAGYEKRWNRRIRVSVIKLITSQFPVLQTISLSFVTKKYAYNNCDVVVPRPWWKAVITKLYKDAFLNGSRDDRYDSPVRQLEAEFLTKALAVAGLHHVKVLVNSSVWWETDSGRLLLILGVSFQVTPDGWTAVDRDWRSGCNLDRSRSEYSSTNNFDRCMQMAKTCPRVYEGVI